ncbi:MAG: MFS transporter [Nitrospinae bacterium]|nr:MFS transporter [Nitrospinota bacterium]
MPREKRIVALASMAHYLIHMNILIFPAIVMPFSREMGLSIAEVFPLSFMMYFLYGALALPAGYVADLWSKSALLKICMFGVGIGSLLAGMSTSVTDFTMALAVIGLFCGLYHPVGLGLIAKEIEEQGKAHGINGIFGALGEASAPLLAGLTLLFFDWRWVYIIAGMLGIAGFFLGGLFSFDERPHHEIEAVKGKDTHKKEYWLYFAILCFAMTLGGFTYRANLTALPAYFEMRASELVGIIASFTPSTGANAGSGAAGLLVSTLYMFTIAGQYVGGRIADAMDLRKAYFMVQTMALPFVAAMFFLTDMPLYVVTGLFLFFSLGMQPIENSLVTKFLPRRWLSTGYGIKFTFTFGLGSIAVYEVAAIEKWRGLNWIYAALTGQVLLLSLTAALLIALTYKRLPRVMNKEPRDTTERQVYAEMKEDAV